MQLSPPIIIVYSDNSMVYLRMVISKTKSFDSLLPDAPHPYCPYQHLQEIAKPLVHPDRKLIYSLVEKEVGIFIQKPEDWRSSCTAKP